MRIWLAPSRYAPHLGGIETVTAQLALVLAADGHVVKVLTHLDPKGLAAREVLDGVSVRRLVFEAPSRCLSSTRRFVTSQRRLRRALDASPRPDVIHVHGLSNQGLPLARYAASRHIPFFATTHGEITGDVYHIYERSRYARAALRHACSVAEALTAPSSQTLAEAVRLAPHAAGKAVVVPNGVNRKTWEDAGPAPRSHRVMAWGRLERQKGFDRLLWAWPLVRSRVPDAALDIAGEGSEHAALQALSSPGVRLLGRLKQDAVAQALRDVQFAAVPSRVEAFGMSALEALAAGRRVLHSGVPTLADLVAEHGWSAQHDDPSALAAKVVTALLEDPVTVPGSATAAYGWDHVADRYLELYETACRLRGTR